MEQLYCQQGGGEMTCRSRRSLQCPPLKFNPQMVLHDQGENLERSFGNREKVLSNARKRARGVTWPVERVSILEKAFSTHSACVGATFVTLCLCYTPPRGAIRKIGSLLFFLSWLHFKWPLLLDATRPTGWCYNARAGRSS